MSAMKRTAAAVLGILGIVLMGYPAPAAELKSIALRDGRIVVSISGELAEGDTGAFKAAVKSANDAGKFVGSVSLNSSGGSLLVGVELAELVKFAKMATSVGQGATCASACFLIFAAGETKFANYTAQIGVHGASDPSGRETAGSEAATISMARIARELGVPAAIIGRMVVTPPSEMVWLSPPDLQSMGTTMVGKPSQLPPPVANTKQLPDGPPLNLSPKEKASASMSWDEMFDKAVATSASQNDGKPHYFRVCQPENKTCNTGVSLKARDGTDIVAKITKDINDKIIRRETCTFNATNDIRLCLDWDRNIARRDMKNVKGDWYKISDD
jgi:hypothetical protein